MDALRQVVERQSAAQVQVLQQILAALQTELRDVKNELKAELTAVNAKLTDVNAKLAAQEADKKSAKVVWFSKGFDAESHLAGGFGTVTRAEQCKNECLAEFAAWRAANPTVRVLSVTSNFAQDTLVHPCGDWYRGGHAAMCVTYAP
jgi:hypothetical protein